MIELGLDVNMGGMVSRKLFRYKARLVLVIRMLIFRVRTTREYNIHYNMLFLMPID